MTASSPFGTLRKTEEIQLLFRGTSVIKSELIQKIAAANPHLYHRDVERIVNVVFDEIVDALAQGDRVELRGFGAFTVKHRAARQGRNPRTGEAVQVPPKRLAFFKVGKELRERVNNGRSKRTPSSTPSSSSSSESAPPTPTVGAL